MKDTQNDLRRLRCVLFLAIMRFGVCFFLLLLLLLTAEVDASNDEAAGSGKGMGGPLRKHFLL